MAGELAALRDANGAPYKLVELPLPAPQYDPADGHRLPAGYANFLIANGCVLMPSFDDPADARGGRDHRLIVSPIATSSPSTAAH